MTQYIFFSGKGGVGKTTMAATTAVHNAGKGIRTLLVSTDPAGNLGDIFEKEVKSTPVQLANNLFVAQMDSTAITEAYKDKMLAPLAEILDGLELEQVKEEFNSGCTVEIATFDKFTDFLSEKGYDLIVFDTAPTGHTLRLMTLPGEWNQFILKSAEGSGQTCIGPVSQIEGSRIKYEQAVKTLQDADQTTVYLVSRPEKTSVYETFRAKSELERTGIHNFRLIINGIFQNLEPNNGLFSSLAKNQIKYIEELERRFDQVTKVPMQSAEVKGLKTLTRFGDIVFEQVNDSITNEFPITEPFNGFSDSSRLSELLVKQTESRLIVLTGKGGVGKTVAACATAWEMAKKGKTLLLTTDPASHIGQVIDADVNHIPVLVEGMLWAANIEQKQAVEAYREKIINQAKADNYSDELMVSLQEELESPCTEEIAIFEEFSRFLQQPQWEYVVLDTAPTGHTLRLLELPFEYKEQMDYKNRKNNNASVALPTANNSIEKLISRMKNPAETTFLLVAYPEFTPLYESHRAMKDLQRVGIETGGVLVNHILSKEDCSEGFAYRRWQLQQNYLHIAAQLFKDKPLFNIPLFSREINGLTCVKEMANAIFIKDLLLK